jgi:SRSO17 transposase
MVLKASTEPLPELAEFLAPFAHHFQRSEGRGDLERYSTGLLSDIPRKNGDTIADAIPGTNAQKTQELLTRIVWDQAAFNAQRIELMRDEVRLGDGVIILDDTGFAKQGKHSVGVARQYSGTLGKVGNCQVAVTGVYADPAVSWPLSVRLYLHKEWADDPARCARAGVPKDVGLETKPQIALHILDEARRLKVPHKAVVADAAYGADPLFLGGLESREEPYVVGVPCDFSVEVKGQSQQGSRRADFVLHTVPLSSWKTISWREGTKGWLKKKFVAIRAYRTLGGQRKRLGWLLGERPARGQQGDWKYYFSNFSKSTPLETMVEYVHRRWHIEQFHEDAKSLLGWDDYQGRLWTGFHRHAIVVMLTYSFLRWRQWKMQTQAPRLRGRPRNPFSPSKGPKTTSSAAGPSTGC